MRGPLIVAAASAFSSMALAFVIKTYADALFLAEYGVAYVPHFMVGQAIALVGLAWVYGRLIKSGRTLTFDTAILVALMAAAAVAPWLEARGRPWPFIVSLTLIAGAALAQMVVWNAASSVVSGRAARAFIPRAGAAATGGAVVGGFASSAIVGIASLQALASVAAGLAIVTLGLRFALRSTAVMRRTSGEIAAVGGKDEPRVLHRLVMLLAAATVVEAVLSAVIDYGFKREVDYTFAADSERIGLFLSLFYGTSNVVLLGIQMFAASRLLATRSLKFSLGVQPVVQAMAAIAWATAPLLPLAAICRGLENVFKFGIARPAQEVALAPLRDIQRKRWKVLLRGVFAQGGSLAAGLLLIALAPLFALHPSLVPLFAAALAIAWWVLQRRTASTYRQTLGSALGLRRRLHRGGDEPPTMAVDRDSLARVIDMAGDADDDAAKLAAELMDDLVEHPARLVPHLRADSAKARAAMYRVLAARPSRSHRAALAGAIAAEARDSPALGDGLLCLAAHLEGSEVERARSLCASAPPDTTREPAASAWLYLAALSAVDEDARDRVLAANLGASGRRAAILCQALRDRGALDLDQIAERVITAIDDAPTREQAREGLYVAARLGHPALLGRLLHALGEGIPGAAAPLAQLPTSALRQMAQMIADLAPSPRIRARFIRAMRAVDAREVTEVVTPYLADEAAEVRDMAAHTLLAQIRRGHPRPHMRPVHEALERQLDRLELYAMARPSIRRHHRESAMSLQLRHFARGDITQEAFFLDELDRRTERCLGRVADLLALTGDPTTVYAAERALGSSSFKRRRQALDLLQETVSGRLRARLIDLLERYLMPPQDNESARSRVCAIDPWLERCRQTSGDTARKLWALRRAPLFDAVPGEGLERLLGHCEVCTFEEGELVFSQGDAGDALYVVMDGIVSVKVDDKVVAQLGAGDAFGELALLDGQPRTGTAKVLQSCVALRLPAAPFRQALESVPELGHGLILSLVRILRGKLEA